MALAVNQPDSTTLIINHRPHPLLELAKLGVSLFGLYWLGVLVYELSIGNPSDATDPLIRMMDWLIPVLFFVLGVLLLGSGLWLLFDGRPRIVTFNRTEGRVTLAFGGTFWLPIGIKTESCLLADIATIEVKSHRGRMETFSLNLTCRDGRHLLLVPKSTNREQLAQIQAAVEQFLA